MGGRQQCAAAIGVGIPITPICSQRVILARKLDSCSEVYDALQAKPDGLDPWLAVAFACKESAQHGHQAQHFVESRRFCRLLSVIQDVRSLPLVGFKQKRRVQIGAGSPHARCISLAIRQASTMNSASARSSRSRLLSWNFSTRQPFLSTSKKSSSSQRARYQSINSVAAPKVVGQQAPLHGFAANWCLDTGAFTMAWFRRKPGPGVLFHSHRGSQHASQAMAAKRTECGMTASLS